MAINKNNQLIKQAVEVFRAGGLVIYPTETTYGAGVLATNQSAVNKLLAYKTRREGKPLSIAVANQKMAKQYVELNDQARMLYQQFLPGPVTVISKSFGKVAKGVESEFGTLGIRIPDHPLILEVVKKLGFPVTATSANASGKKRPYSINDLMNNLSVKQKKLIDFVIDVGVLPSNPPSIVIDTTLSAPMVVRDNPLWQQKIFGSSQKIRSIELISANPAETQTIASRVMSQNWENLKQTGLIIALNGPLGAGKTVFAQGVAKWLGIKQNLVSPTYTYVEEYDYCRQQISGQLYHIDTWKVDNIELAAKLELESLIKPHNILVIEWFDQITDYLLPLLNQTQVKLISVSIGDIGRDKRSISIK